LSAINCLGFNPTIRVPKINQEKAQTSSKVFSKFQIIYPIPFFPAPEVIGPFVISIQLLFISLNYF